MSKVAIIGGHGQIALLLARELDLLGHTPSGVIRNAAQQADLSAVKCRPIVLDIETASVEELASAIDGADTVVFAAGGGPNSGPERKETVDHQAAVKSAAAAKEIGAEHFIQISYIGAETPAKEDEDEDWKAYQRAKAAADEELMQTSLRWTIVRPGRLINNPATELVKIGADVTGGDTSRANVAKVIAFIIDKRVAEKQIVNVIEGETPIAEAFSNL